METPRAYDLPDAYPEGMVFPPPDIERRNRIYENRRLLYHCEEKYIKTQVTIPEEARFVPFKVGPIIAKVQSNWLWRLGFKMTWGNDDKGQTVSPETKAAAARIVQQTGLMSALKKATQAAVYRGDAYLRATHNPQSFRATEFGVTIDAPNPSSVIPHFQTGNDEAVTALSSYWIETEPIDLLNANATRRRWVNVESIVPGRIVKRRYPLRDGGKLGAVEQEQVMDSEAGNAHALVHVPNGEPEAGYYGVSDIEEVGPYIVSGANALTRMERALNTSLFPKWVVPQSAAKLDEESGEFIIDLSMGEALLRESQDDKFEIISWQGDLVPAAEFVKSLRELMFLITGVSDAALGVGVGAGDAESGVALALRMILTIFETDAKKAAWQAGIEEVIYAAQNIETQQGATYTPAKPTVEIPDTVPKDALRTMELIERATAKGLMEEDEAYALLHPNIDPEDVPEILARIRTSKQAAQAVNPIGQRRNRLAAAANGQQQQEPNAG